MRYSILTITFFAFILSCLTQRTKNPVGSCVQAIQLNQLQYFPEHFLPFARGADYTVTGAPDNTYSHYGNAKYAWDIASRDGNAGSPLVATIDGCIRAVKRNATVRKGKQGDANNVNYVILSWPKNISDRYSPGTNLESLYLHLESVDPNIYPGKCVQRGDRLGITGCTGWCTGIHLHYQVQKRPANGSYWGVSVPIGFAERVLPQAGTKALSQNPGPTTHVRTVQKPTVTTAPKPANPEPKVEPKPKVESPTQDTAPLNLVYICSELKTEHTRCLNRITGFSKRQELIHCAKSQIEHCVMGCAQNDAGANDACVSAKGDHSTDNTKEVPSKKTEDDDKVDPMENGDDLPPSELPNEETVPKHQKC